MTNINFDDFKKLDMRVGEVKEAEPIDGADKLLRLQVDTGDNDIRQLVAGLANHYSVDDLVGKKIIVLTNLEPKELMGVESQGMLLAANSENGPVLLTPEKDAIPGSKIS